MVVETEELLEHLLLEGSLRESPVFFDAVQPGSVRHVVDESYIVLPGKFLDHRGPVITRIVEQECTWVRSLLLQLAEELQEGVGLDALRT